MAQVKRQAIRHVIAQHHLSERRACKAATLVRNPEGVESGRMRRAGMVGAVVDGLEPARPYSEDGRCADFFGDGTYDAMTHRGPLE